MFFSPLLAGGEIELSPPSIAPGLSSWGGTTTAASASTTAGTTQATGSTFVVVTNSHGGALSADVKDNFGNVYTLASSVLYENVEYLGLYYCINGKGGSGHVVTADWAASGVTYTVGLTEFKNVGAGTIGPTPAGTQVSGTALAAPTIKTYFADELVVNVFGSYNAYTETVTDSGAGFAISASDGGSGTYLNGAISWRVPVSPGTYGDTLNFPNTTYAGALALSIRPPAAPMGLGQDSLVAAQYTNSLSTAPQNTQATGSSFVAFTAQGKNTVSISDTIGGIASGNVWTQKVTDLEFNGIYGGLNVWVCANGKGGADHVCTFASASSSSIVGGLIEAKGATTLDQLVTLVSAGNTTTPTTGSATTTSANEILIAIFAGGNEIYSAATNGFSLESQEADSGGTFAAAFSIDVVSAIGPYSTGLTTQQANSAYSTALLTFSAPSPPIAIGQKSSGGGASVSTVTATMPAATSANNSTFVAFVGYRNTTHGYQLPPTVGDTIGGVASGNVWTLGQSVVGIGSYWVWAAYHCINGKGGANQVFSASGWTYPADLAEVVFLEFPNVGAGSLDSAPTGYNSSGVQPTSIVAPKATTSAPGDLVVSGALYYSSDPGTFIDSGSGFSPALSHGDGVTANGSTWATSWAAPASPGSYGDTFNFSGTGDYAVALTLAFKTGALSSGGASLAGAATDAVTASGTLTVEASLTAAATDTISATGALTAAVSLAGAATDAVTAAAALTVTSVLAGAAVDTTTATGTLPLYGNATDTTSAAGALTVAAMLAASATTLTSATGSLATTLAGAATDATSATALLTVKAALTGAASDLTAATGALTAAVALVAAAIDASSATGALTPGASGLTGAAADAVTSSAVLTAQVALAGAALDTVTAIGALTAQVALAAAAIDAVSATGALSVIGQIGGNATDSTSAAALLTVKSMLAAAASDLTAASASLTVNAPLLAVATDTVIASATLLARAQLAAGAGDTTAAGGNLTVQAALLGNAVDAIITQAFLAGATGVPILLSHEWLWETEDDEYHDLGIFSEFSWPSVPGGPVVAAPPRGHTTVGAPASGKIVIAPLRDRYSIVSPIK